MIWRYISVIVCLLGVFVFNRYTRSRQGVMWDLAATVVTLVIGPLIFYLVQSIVEFPGHKKESQWTTGSSKFPIIVTDMPFTDKNRIVFKVKNEDDFPVYNVTIRTTNLNAFADASKGHESPEINGVLQPMPMAEGEEKIFEGNTFNVGTLNPRELREFHRVDASAIPGKWKDADFVFSFQVGTLTGYGWQYMTWIRQGEELMNKSTLVYTLKGEATMERAISSRNFTEKAKWDYGPIPSSSSKSRWKSPKQ